MEILVKRILTAAPADVVSADTVDRPELLDLFIKYAPKHPRKQRVIGVRATAAFGAAVNSYGVAPGQEAGEKLRSWHWVQ